MVEVKIFVSRPIISQNYKKSSDIFHSRAENVGVWRYRTFMCGGSGIISRFRAHTFSKLGIGGAKLRAVSGRIGDIKGQKSHKRQKS